MGRDLITFGHFRRLLIGLVPLFAVINLSYADVLAIPEPPTPHAGMPATGLSMEEVLNNWGEPSKRHDVVSDPGNAHRPPINRWDYPSFSVIFERDKVIHTVHSAHPPKVIAPPQ